MKVIYEDKDVLALDKPAGISVHPRPGDTTEKTIVSEIKGKVTDTDKERPGIVHRLDKDTSGVLVVAKNPQAKVFLQRQFKEHKVGKTYIALVQGVPKQAPAVIKLPVGRHPKHPLKRAIRPGGKPASTEYRVIKKYTDKALLECYPTTGRTHQIRLHLAHIGHPIIGDKLYGKPEPTLGRHFLHAKKLTLMLPSGTIKSFASPLPPKLNTYLRQL